MQEFKVFTDIRLESCKRNTAWQKQGINHFSVHSYAMAHKSTFLLDCHQILSKSIKLLKFIFKLIALNFLTHCFAVSTKMKFSNQNWWRLFLLYPMLENYYFKIKTYSDNGKNAFINLSIPIDPRFWHNYWYR